MGLCFGNLHELFDRLANDVLPALDDLAERVRMIGQDPSAHLIEAADIASVAAPAPHSTMRDMIEEPDRQMRVVIKEIRDAVKVADEHGDPIDRAFTGRATLELVNLQVEPNAVSRIVPEAAADPDRLRR